MPREDSSEEVYQVEMPEDEFPSWTTVIAMVAVTIAWGGGMAAGIAVYSTSRPVVQEVLRQPVRVLFVSVPLHYFALWAAVTVVGMMAYIVYKDNAQ